MNTIYILNECCFTNMDSAQGIQIDDVYSIWWSMLSVRESIEFWEL